MDPEKIVKESQDLLPLKTEEIIELVGKASKQGEPEMRVLVFMDIFNKIKDYQVLTCTNYNYFNKLMNGPDAISLSNEGLYSQIYKSILCNFGVMGGMSASDLKSIYGMDISILDSIKELLTQYLSPDSEYRKNIQTEVDKLKEQQQLEEEIRIQKRINIAQLNEIKEYIEKIQNNTAVGSYRNETLQERKVYEKIKKLLYSVLTQFFYLKDVDEDDTLEQLLNKISHEINHDYSKNEHIKIYILLRKMQKGIVEETMPSVTKPTSDLIPIQQTGGYDSDTSSDSDSDSGVSNKSYLSVDDDED